MCSWMKCLRGTKLVPVIPGNQTGYVKLSEYVNSRGISEERSWNEKINILRNFPRKSLPWNPLFFRYDGLRGFVVPSVEIKVLKSIR